MEQELEQEQEKQKKEDGRKRKKHPSFTCSLSGMVVHGNHGHALRINGVDYPISYASHERMIKEIGSVNCVPGDDSIVQVRRIVDDGETNENNLDFCVSLELLGAVHGWVRKVKAIVRDAKKHSVQPEAGRITVSKCGDPDDGHHKELALVCD